MRPRVVSEDENNRAGRIILNMRLMVPMNIAKIRERAGLTSRKLADELGISTSHMSMIEHGHRALTLELAAKLEEATKTPGLVAELVRKKTGREPSEAA